MIGHYDKLFDLRMFYIGIDNCMMPYGKVQFLKRFDPICSICSGKIVFLQVRSVLIQPHKVARVLQERGWGWGWGSI
jgi:hypothetical protein